MAWHDLFAAVALMLIIEGIVPFMSPASLRKTYQRMLEMNDRSIRITGLISMIAGAILLTYVR